MLCYSCLPMEVKATRDPTRPPVVLSMRSRVEESRPGSQTWVISMERLKRKHPPRATSKGRICDLLRLPGKLRKIRMPSGIKPKKLKKISISIVPVFRADI